MSLVEKFLAKLRLRQEVPIINTQWGPVTESARRQAAANMAEDPDLRDRVEKIVIQECGGDIARGLAECKRRYPEAYE